MTFEKEYVKSMKLAGYLMFRGFRILEVRKDKFNPNYDVYVFRKTEDLMNIMVNYINGENGGNKNGNYNKNCNS